MNVNDTIFHQPQSFGLALLLHDITDNYWSDDPASAFAVWVDAEGTFYVGEDTATKISDLFRSMDKHDLKAMTYVEANDFMRERAERSVRSRVNTYYSFEQLVQWELEQWRNALERLDKAGGPAALVNRRYPLEILGPDDDDGTMPSNVETLAEAVVGHRIVEVKQVETERWWGGRTETLELVLDNGKAVRLRDTDDCCAYTELVNVIKHLDQIDHIITGVGTTDGYSRWHIYADMGDVLELEVAWSAGNPFYYGYGFGIEVVEVEQTAVLEAA